MKVPLRFVRSVKNAAETYLFPVRKEYLIRMQRSFSLQSLRILCFSTMTSPRAGKSTASSPPFGKRVMPPCAHPRTGRASPLESPVISLGTRNPFKEGQPIYMEKVVIPLRSLVRHRQEICQQHKSAARPMVSLPPPFCHPSTFTHLLLTQPFASNSSSGVGDRFSLPL